MSTRQSRATLAALVAAVFALSLLVARVLYTGRPTYLFLVWNLLLAMIPLALALPARGGAGRFALWLLFFPNAPYLVTDLVHLRPRAAPYWFDIGMLVAFGWAGLFAGTVALERMVARVEGRARWLVLAGVGVSSGFAIWLGRFLRLNSWDPIVRPASSAERVLSALTGGLGAQAAGVTALFGALVLVVFLGTLSLRRDTT